MITYKKDPNLGLPVVETVQGDREYRRNCRSVKGQYYVKDRDIYFIEETNLWYRRKSIKVDYDYERNICHLKGTVKLTTGVVGFDEKGSPIIGQFTANEFNNCQCVLPSGSKQIAISTDVLLKANYFEDVSHNTYYAKARSSAADIKAMEQIRPNKGYTNKGYNIEDNATEFENKKRLYAKSPIKINEDARTYGKYLTDITFGAELECSVGNLPLFIENRHGLVACRDGSLEGGPEFVTVPMSGAKGIQNLITVSKEMQKRCDVDIRCAYHIHIGTLPTERIFLTALYMLCYGIQADVFKMFPGYKLDHRGIKRKNYCQMLQKMSIHPLKDFSKSGYEQFTNDVYNKIFEFLSDGHAADLDVNRKQQRHPIERKYERSSRYYWINFQNMLFSPRVTTEFRIASPTLNPQRLVNWLFMCNAIVKYAQYNMKKIIQGDKITFKEVLNVYADHWSGEKDAKFLSEYLQAYYTERCTAFAKDAEKGDKVSEWELISDKKYKFSYQDTMLFVK